MKDILDLSDLLVFNTIASSGSVVDACNKLKISYHTARKAMETLENQLNTKLYNLGKGQVFSLTPPGNLLYNLTKSDIETINLAKEAFIDQLNGMKGRLKVATTTTFGSWWLPRRLNDFYQLYKIPLDIIATDEKVDLLTQAHASIGFEPHSHPDIINREVLTYKLKIYGTKKYIDTYGEPKSLEDLKNHKVLVYGDSLRAPTPKVNWIIKDSKGNNIFEPLITLNNALGIIEVVKSGIAIATLAEYIAKDHCDLIPLRIAAEYPSVSIYFSYHMLLENSVKIKAFSDFIWKELNK